MVKRESGRLMLESEIPAFVDAVIEAGCDICAIGHDCYVLGDLEEMDAAADELDRIGEVFGDRDFLLLEIVAYLRSLGRYLEPGPSPGHWSDKKSALRSCMSKDDTLAFEAMAERILEALRERMRRIFPTH